MAKLLALEWDEREARVAVATPRGSEVVVEEAFAIDISAVASEDVAGDPHEVGRRIAEALAQHGLTGSDALVGLGRASIELRSLSLPPAPPDELPDLVRFQAMQAFTAIGEDWPLDFVELGTQEDSLNVLAAVLSPKQVEQILQVCAASELKPRCLVLRPFAAASLLNRGHVLAAGRNALIVDMLADGADLTVISQGLVVFMRTVRLPATDDPNVQARALLGEVRRTIGAAQAQVSGQRIEQIIICGSASEHPVLAQSLTEALSLDVVLFDPFQAVRVAGPLQRQLPADSGRYAPLLGMLADEAAGVRHAIDFLNPRKRPTRRSHRRRDALIAAAGLAAVGVAGLAIWAGLKHRDGQIADLRTQAAALDKQVEQARKLVAKADAVKDFTDGEVTWLDEMYELARRIPDADHVKLEDVRFGTDLKRGGVMTLKGNVKSSDVIAEFEDSLRYDGNVVAGRYGTIDRNQRDYPYLLDTTVVVAPDTYDRGRSQGRPFRDKLRKRAAESQAEAEVEAKAEAKPESPPEAKPESTLEPKPESEPESRKTEAPTSEMKKVDGQPTEATGSENS
jgi:Tfp pilus assembly PilM family ATPase/Tfp pilus assembly protein PilN